MIKPLNDIDECTQFYFKQLKPFKPLHREEERKLLIDYKINNNITSRNKLITSNLKYACQLANSYRGQGIPYSQLISEANMGLIHAIDKYDMKMDVKLLTYARWWMIQNMKESINKHAQLNEDDLPDEYINPMDNVNVDYTIDNDDMSAYQNNSFIEEEQNDDYMHMQTLLNEMYQLLTPKEIDIIKMNFGITPYNKSYTIEEIAIKYNKSSERIRQVKNNIFKKMRSVALTIPQKMRNFC